MKLNKDMQLLSPLKMSINTTGEAICNLPFIGKLPIDVTAVDGVTLRSAFLPQLISNDRGLFIMKHTISIVEVSESVLSRFDNLLPMA